MTDFFADLEREIRAAHPRRSRPVVPVKGIAATAAVAATLVAVVLALGALAPTAEKEVATQGTPDPQPTAVMPAECKGKVVDGRIPDELVDRFAILRGDAAEVVLPADRIPGAAAEVIRQSLREVEGPGGRGFAFAIVRMGDMNCAPSDLGVCLFSLDAGHGTCELADRAPFMTWVIHNIADGKRLLAAVGDDDVDAVQVDRVTSVPLEANVGFKILGGEHDPSIEPVTPDDGEEVVPLNCSTAPAMSAIKKQLVVFRDSPSRVSKGLVVNLPQGWHRMYLDEVREIGGHYVFPATDGRCETGVCIVAADDPKAECQTLFDGKIVVTLIRRDGDRARVAGLARDGLATVKVTSGGTTQEIAVNDNLFVFTAPSEEFTVEPGS